MRTETSDITLPIFRYKNPTGLIDILPESHRYWHHIENLLTKLSTDFGYRRLITPPVDARSLYKLAFGDQLNSQLVDLGISDGGENFVFRAHPRVGIIRSFKENDLASWPPPVRVYYQTDTLQKQDDSFIQKHYFCLDVLGAKDLTTNTNTLFLLTKLAKEFKLKNPTLVIYSNGCPKCRPAYQKAYGDYCQPYKSQLCSACSQQPTLSDLTACENDAHHTWLEDAPAILDFLCPTCHDQLTSILEVCDNMSIPYDVNHGSPSHHPEAEQTTIGLKIGDEVIPALVAYHFDDFASKLAETPLTAIGLTVDIPKFSQYLDTQHATLPDDESVQVFIAQLGQQAKTRCIPLLQQLFNAGYCVVTAGESESITSQLQLAERLHARVTLIVGQKEAVNGHVIMRDMTSGLQDDVYMDELVSVLGERLAVA